MIRYTTNMARELVDPIMANPDPLDYMFNVDCWETDTIAEQTNPNIAPALDENMYRDFNSAYHKLRNAAQGLGSLSIEGSGTIIDPEKNQAHIAVVDSRTVWEVAEGVFQPGAQYEFSQAINTKKARDASGDYSMEAIQSKANQIFAELDSPKLPLDSLFMYRQYVSEQEFVDFRRELLLLVPTKAWSGEPITAAVTFHKPQPKSNTRLIRKLGGKPDLTPVIEVVSIPEHAAGLSFRNEEMNHVELPNYRVVSQRYFPFRLLRQRDRINKIVKLARL